MAGDDLFFLRTGEESRPYVLLTLRGERSDLAGEATLEGTGGGEGTDDFPGIAGDLPTALRDAKEYALLKGLDLRIDLNGREWPESLGILGNR